MAKDKFEDAMREAIVSLPQDMKAMLRIVEDPDLDDDGRTLAAGALIHVLSVSNTIPGQRGLLAYLDDVIVLRLVLERLQKQAPDVMKRHSEESPELMGPLEDQMAAVRGYLGELLQVLDKAVDELPKLNHHGHSARDCARDEEASTWLYDAVHEALLVDLEFDEDDVARELKQVDRIKRPLEQRLQS
ncbi:MAG TPA: hypothetical protein RMH99_28120 [Sandaracinaceae bacterium LLY-WYZ-13_1]|nr:hypothetical protein [Sandaracinaceae bacterium LLY-WYZ-13_1]